MLVGLFLILGTTCVVKLQLLVIKSTWRTTQGLCCWIELSRGVCVWAGGECRKLYLGLV